MKVRFMELAKKVSTLSDHPQHRHGAAIVRGNKLISVGANKTKTHPMSTHPFRSTHAELAAILNSRETDLTNCELYLYRENSFGEKANSRPCKFCLKLLNKFNIKIVHYTDSGTVKTEFI